MSEEKPWWYDPRPVSERVHRLKKRNYAIGIFTAFFCFSPWIPILIFGSFSETALLLLTALFVLGLLLSTYIALVARSRTATVRLLIDAYKLILEQEIKANKGAGQ